MFSSCFLAAALFFLPAAASAGSILALDFNAEDTVAPESYSTAAEVRAVPSLANEGTIDSFRGAPSRAAKLTIAGGARPPSWSAGLRTPLLAVSPGETALEKLTLAFDLETSTPRPVRVRIASFDAARQCSGGLEGWVYPPVAGSFHRQTIILSEMHPWQGKFDPQAAFIQLSWEVGSDAPQGWSATEEVVVHVDNVSLATPSFYVSATGSDQADGRTEATAFRTIQRGLSAAAAGDTVLVMDGVYAGGVMEKSGTPAKWITLQNAPGAKPRVEFEGWAGLTIRNGAAYFEINGLEIVGNAHHVTHEDAVENGRAEKPDAKFNGTAISIEGKTLEEGRTVKDEKPYRDRADRPHHLRIIGCHIHDACGAGVAGMVADYVTIEGNTVTDCAARSRYAHSGITLYWAWNFDGSTGHRNVIRNNVTARNRTRVAWQPRWVDDPAKAFVSDGNGIIVDDFIQHQPGAPGDPNAGRTLVQNNLSHHNGGGGVHIFASDRVDVVNNTAFANCQTDIIDYGEIDTSWSHDCRVFNNVAVASPGKSVHRNRSRQNKPEESNVWEHNVLFADGKKEVRDFSGRDSWADPLFIQPEPDAPPSAFALATGSPARDFGTAGELVCARDLLGVDRPISGKCDGGAIQSPAPTGLAETASQRNVTPHPVPWECASARYGVTVNGRPVSVFLATMNLHFASFDFAGKAEVQVTINDDNYHHADGHPFPKPDEFWQGAAVVRPLARGVAAKTEGRTVTFTITQPGQYAIEPPGTGGFEDEVLFLFANPPERDVPSAADRNVIWLGPGVHQRHVNLASGQTLYLAPGAVLFGGINVWDAENVRICGRGVVLYYGPQSMNVDSGWLHRRDWHPLTTHAVHGLKVEGVTFIGRSRVWTIQLCETFDSVFENIKVLTSFPANLNGDGIDWYGGGRSVVRDSFFRTADDCFAVHPADASLALRVDRGGGSHLPGAPATEVHHARGEVGDFTIERCVFWPTVANIFRAGWSNQSLTTHDVTVRDCDVIHISPHVWLGAADALFTAVSPDGSGDGEHRDYLFENIHVESSGALCAVNWPRTTLRNFHFKDIHFPAGVNQSFVRASADGLHFENVRVGGQVARDAEALKLRSEGSVKNVTFPAAP
jgi:hypothetical protein